MEYKELCNRINIELYNNKHLEGIADTKDIDIYIKNIEDENAHCFVHINSVQMEFRKINFGLQKVIPEEENELWLLILGKNDEKCIQIKNIDEIYFNYKGYGTIHG